MGKEKRLGFNIMDKKTIINKINELKKENNAIILAHNYQTPDIQDIADVVGDSAFWCEIASPNYPPIPVVCACSYISLPE